MDKGLLDVRVWPHLEVNVLHLQARSDDSVLTVDKYKKMAFTESADFKGLVSLVHNGEIVTKDNALALVTMKYRTFPTGFVDAETRKCRVSERED